MKPTVILKTREDYDVIKIELPNDKGVVTLKTSNKYPNEIEVTFNEGYNEQMVIKPEMSNQFSIQIIERK